MKKIKKPIIISPSGNLYGSEKVLIDFIEGILLKEIILFTPSKSKLSKNIFPINVKKKEFKSPRQLYSVLFFSLLFGKVDLVYCNEAGHSKYIAILARIFKHKKFLMHVRLLEDTSEKRYPLGLSENVKLISVSRYIQSQLKFNNIFIYDGFNFENLNEWKEIESDFNIGIVGRTTLSKGFKEIFQIIKLTNRKNVFFYFYGDIYSDVIECDEFKELVTFENVFFNGFESDKEKIYNDLHAVLHINGQEALGRIFFEALDFGVPLIGIDEGGIGEISTQINYPCFIHKRDINFLLNICDDINNFEKKMKINRKAIDESRINAMKIFSVNKYVTNLLTEF